MQGVDVWDIGQVTTDMVYFAVGKNDLAGGIMITASHNPAKFNGIKICAREAQAVGIESGLADIRDSVIKNAFKPAMTVGKVISKDIIEDWVNFALSFIKPDKLLPLKIAVDAGNGMAGKIFPEIEPYVPFKVTEMYFKLDGTFPNHEANPQKTETLRQLISTIKKNGLDSGIAFDGDGDRAFLVDERGQTISGSAMTAMLAEYFLKKHPGSKIVYGLTASRIVPDVISRNGGQPVVSKTGHSFIKQLMREVDAPFGGEASGHFYFRDNWYADSGLIAVLISLYILSTSGKKLSELRQQYSRYVTLSETNFKVANKDIMVAKLKQAFAQNKQNLLDGLSVNLDDGSWFNIRPSNTEPVLRLNAEARTKIQLDKLVAKVTKVITSA